MTSPVPSYKGTEKEEQAKLPRGMDLLRELSLTIAAAVAKIALDRGLAGIEKSDDTHGFIKSCMYDPTYPEYTR